MCDDEASWGRSFGQPDHPQLRGDPGNQDLANLSFHRPKSEYFAAILDKEQALGKMEGSSSEVVASYGLDFDQGKDGKVDVR